LKIGQFPKLVYVVRLGLLDSLHFDSVHS
jgi:hypothetical protein